MAAGAHIAIIAILVIVVGVFLLLVGTKVAPSSGGWQPRPDPHLKDYIEDVQRASSNLYNATQTLRSAASNVSSLVGGTFGAYDKNSGVDDAAPAAARKDVDAALSSVAERLENYAGEVGLYNTTVQAWTVSTPDYTMMGQTTAVDALVKDVLDPMAEFLEAAGQLSTFVNDWAAAYESASGGVCSHSSDCDKHHQRCTGGRCSATMNPTMQGLVDGVGSAAKTFSAQGALDTSPYRKLAGVTRAAYIALFDHIAGSDEKIRCYSAGGPRLLRPRAAHTCGIV